MTTEITNDNYAAIVAEGAVVIDFWAPWCGPCRMISPLVDELAAEYQGRVTVCKCNVDSANRVAAEYGIRNIPTILFFRNGELVDRQVGAAPKGAIEENIKKLL